MSQRITPTVGRVVLYCLSADDATHIHHRQLNGEHATNPTAAGQVLPAIVVRTWGDTPDSAVNLQVLLDGNGSHWATSRTVSDGPEEGRFHWMPYQLSQARAAS